MIFRTTHGKLNNFKAMLEVQWVLHKTYVQTENQLQVGFILNANFLSRKIAT